MSQLGIPDEQLITSRLSGAASLRRELEAVLHAASAESTHEGYRRLILEDNAAGKASASMRMWTWRRLKVRYLLDPAIAEYRAFFTAMMAASDPGDRGLLAYLMMARTDRLFRDLTTSTVVPYLGIPGHIVQPAEVRAAVDTLGRASELDWSEASAQNIANHALSSLKDFGVLTSSATKRVQAIRPGSIVTVFASRLGRLEGLSDRRLLESRWFKLFGLDLDRVVDLMYVAAQDGSLRFRFQADVAEITLPAAEVAS